MKGDHRMRLGRCRDMAVLAARKWHVSHVLLHSRLVGSACAWLPYACSRQLKPDLPFLGHDFLPSPMSRAMTADMCTS